ncbi:MAG: hypothetical protein ACKVE4_11630 [Dissulfuribacterales bacterium]
MQVNLQDCRRSFPFIATCGMELEKWSRTLTDTLDIFWVDTIHMMALGTALDAFKHHMTDTFETRMTSTMNPGSLEDWPVSEQHKLFSILGDACGTIGVQLNKNGMMVPLKSVSGIEFESGEKFNSCQRGGCRIPDRQPRCSDNRYGRYHFRYDCTEGRTGTG